MEETNWLFDEMFQKVYPNDIPELEPYKGIVKDDLDTLLGDIVPYDLFYYYSNQYIMRYVNNYYNYEKYDPKLFKKNINKAIDNYCDTQKEKAIEYSRAEVVSITELMKGKKFKVFRNGKEGNLTVKYIWRTSSSDACKHCMKMDGKEFNSEKMVRTHWHCRCKIEQITKIVSDDGEILHNSKKLL